ncbi:MAG: hypothetical protein QOJ90_2317 [Actinomycetota bacterium]|nr:hypothetical protein [Actinomycetota bacterium]
MTVNDHRDLVSALLGVAGVSAAAVEHGEGDGELGSLRLQLVPGADEVAVAGAVNQLLRARFGLAVDTDRVRVLDEPAPPPAAPAEAVPAATQEAGSSTARSSTAEAPAVPEAAAVPEAPADPGAQVVGGSPLPDSPAAPRAATIPTVHIARPGRLTIQRVQMVSAGLGVVATVQLGLEGEFFDGKAEGAATATGVQRSVAAATLRAVEAVVAGRARFEVEHLEVAVAGQDRTALVVITMLTGRGSERLSGASVVREDVRQAVIRSVLAAVNRRLEPMLDER